MVVAVLNTTTARRIAAESVLFGVICQEQEIIWPCWAAQSKVAAQVTQVCRPAALNVTMWQLGAIPTTP